MGLTTGYWSPTESSPHSEQHLAADGGVYENIHIIGLVSLHQLDSPPPLNTNLPHCHGPGCWLISACSCCLSCCHLPLSFVFCWGLQAVTFWLACCLLIGLLKRQVKHIFVFLNSEQPLRAKSHWDPSKRPPTSADIDDFVRHVAIACGCMFDCHLCLHIFLSIPCIIPATVRSSLLFSVCQSYLLTGQKPSIKKLQSTTGAIRLENLT